MNINLPVPQHVDHVYVHAPTGLMWMAIGAVVLAVCLLAWGRAVGENDVAHCLVAILLVVGVLPYIGAWDSARSHATLTQTRFRDHQVSAGSDGPRVIDELNNRALNAALRTHYGLSATDPSAEPYNAAPADITTDAAYGTSYIVNDQPVTCALSYSTSHPNNVGMPTKAHIDRVVCAGNNGTHLVKGH